ncbi:MAG: alanine racemase [Candidatus Kapabacteria bacterium]|nr:alanine racemase [Ignavibacteriota bacterium]MCW5883466.1 alanine racemase [Candidatus Kapabacteria bacterium]
MNNSSIITIKKDSVRNNISFLKKKIGKDVKISSVVKANAYGHGIEIMIPLFMENGIDHFSVFDFNEALRVRNSMIDAGSIMIMGWISDTDVFQAIDYGFEFYIFNIERLDLAKKYALDLNKPAKIHLEVETGMNRSGLNISELNKAISIINSNPEIFDIRGFCTHLAGAESIANHLRIQNQIKLYHKLLSFAQSKSIFPAYRHIANSAATFVYPKTRLDLVRIGIMQYGFWSTTETYIHYIRNRMIKNDPLKRILGWKSYVMTLNHVKVGEFIGYGTSYLAQIDMVTAVIPVGYAGGFNRSLSNKGRVIIHGQRCGIIGLVNMNMIIADVSNIHDVCVGDEVVIIGQQGDLEIKVTSFSDISDQLNYEVLSSLPEKIERIVI